MPRLVQQSVALPALPDRLYDMYVDPSLHAEFTGAPVTIGSTPGAEFRAFGDMLSGRIDLMHVNVADHRRVVLLDTTVVTAPKQRAVLVEEGCPDRNPAFSQARSCFLESNVEHCLVIDSLVHG